MMPTQTPLPETAPPPDNPSRSQWSNSLQSVLDQPPAAFPRQVILGGFAFCFAFGLWAWLGKIQEVSHAQGQLVPQGEVYRVQPVITGEVARIRVQEGQTVQAGEVIAELDSQLLAVEVERLQQSLNALRIQLVQAEGLADRTRMEAQTQQAIATAEIQAQEAALLELQATTATQAEVIEHLREDNAAYRGRLDRLEPLVSEGAIAEEQLFEIEQALRDRQRTLTQSQGEFQRVLAERDRLQAGLRQRRAEAQRRDLEISQRLQQTTIEIGQLEARLQETEKLLKAARTQLTQSKLKAPVDGTVTTLNLSNTGEVLQPGQTIAEIAPTGVPLVLAAALPNREAGLVRTGMVVQMRFDAFPFQEFGTVSGKVLSVSPDATSDERLGAVYHIEIALDRYQMQSRTEQATLKAGQTASAEIIIRQRRILDLLLEPIRQLQQGSMNL